MSLANDPDDCDGWPNEVVYDVINVLEAWRDHELAHVTLKDLEMAQELGLMGEDQATEKGKLLLLGWSASQTVAEVEKGLLFQEIEQLKVAEERPGSQDSSGALRTDGGLAVPSIGSVG